jgi:predicted amidohydrolase YtcJ
MSTLRLVLASIGVAICAAAGCARKLEPRTAALPSIAAGAVLTAYIGPRFLTGDPSIPEARTVIADETGRVRQLLATPPPGGAYRVVELPGALAVPGLHDAHIHLQALGRTREQVNLLGARSPAEAKERIRAWAERHQDARAIAGRGWDQSLFPRGDWPTWRDLEGATGPVDRPILVERVDGHAAWANKRMLEIAGIGRETADPPGGKVLRDEKGDPSGVLIDGAVELAAAKLPPPAPIDVERWLLAGMNACAAAGLVAAHDMGMSVAEAEVLLRLDAGKKLPLRVYVYLDGADPAAYDALRTRRPGDRLRLVGVKLFADGAMGSRGAALLEDYADDPGNRGLLLTQPETLAERIARVHQRGFAAAVHAIGDRANRLVLEALKSSPPPPGVRDRIEHAQLVHGEDFGRFAVQGVVASMQPTHATSDMHWVEARVGPRRVLGAYAWRTVLRAGAHLAFGSDAPVEDERPQLGIHAAITRQDAGGDPPGGFHPEQRLTQSEALAAFAAGAAWAVGLEREQGALTPGMSFDVSLFSEDAAAKTDQGDARAWLETTPVGTVIGGALRPGRGP